MNLKIALLPGDGIGPEVIKEAVKICNAISKKFNHSITWLEGLVGAGPPPGDDPLTLLLASFAGLFCHF